MSEKISDLAHAAVNHLNAVSTIAGCLVAKLKDAQDLSAGLKDELIKSLHIVETKAREASGDITKIKEELTSRGQYT